MSWCCPRSNAARCRMTPVAGPRSLSGCKLLDRGSWARGERRARAWCCTCVARSRDLGAPEKIEIFSRSYFPLRVPLVNLNLCIGLTARKSERDSAVMQLARACWKSIQSHRIGLSGVDSHYGGNGDRRCQSWQRLMVILLRGSLFLVTYTFHVP